MFIWQDDAVVICSNGRLFSACEQDYGEKNLGWRMQNKPSHNLLNVGVDLDKTNNYNYYLCHDNVVLPE